MRTYLPSMAALAICLGSLAGCANEAGGAAGAGRAGPVSVTVDPSGRFAYVTNYLGDHASRYRVEANGMLSALLPD